MNENPRSLSVRETSLERFDGAWFSVASVDNPDNLVLGLLKRGGFDPPEVREDFPFPVRRFRYDPETEEKEKNDGRY